MTKQRYLTEEQIAKITLTAGQNIFAAESKLKRAADLKAKFDEKAISMLKDYEILKELYPSLGTIGIKAPLALEWYQELTNKINLLRAAINKAKDNNNYKLATHIAQTNEETEHLIRDILAICEELANDPLLK